MAEQVQVKRVLKRTNSETVDDFAGDTSQNYGFGVGFLDGFLRFAPTKQARGMSGFFNQFNNSMPYHVGKLTGEAIILGLYSIGAALVVSLVYRNTNK
jgi:hypothetical protein